MNVHALSLVDISVISNAIFCLCPCHAHLGTVTFGEGVVAVGIGKTVAATSSVHAALDWVVCGNDVEEVVSVTFHACLGNQVPNSLPLVEGYGEYMNRSFHGEMENEHRDIFIIVLSR